MTTVTAAAWVAWAISKLVENFASRNYSSEERGFVPSPRSLAKGVAFAAWLWVGLESLF
jgi:hypothetical protein